MPRRDSGSNKTGFSVCHREMRARRSAPSACLSLIENQVHIVPNDNRQLAKNEPLERKISPCLKHDKTSRHPPDALRHIFGRHQYPDP